MEELYGSNQTIEVLHSVRISALKQVLNFGPGRRYSGSTMTTVAKSNIRRKVLEYVTGQHAPVRIGTLADNIRKSSVKLSNVDVSDVRAVVQPMIVTGKLSYAPGLTIKLGKKTK